MIIYIYIIIYVYFILGTVIVHISIPNMPVHKIFRISNSTNLPNHQPTRTALHLV